MLATRNSMGDYRNAKGCLAWLGDEPAEVMIRKLRDGDSMTKQRENMTREELLAEITELETQLEAANIVIEKVRSNLLELISGRITDWLNAQGDVSTAGSGAQVWNNDN